MSAFRATFSNSVVISDEAALRTAFECDRLYLAEDATLTVDGTISLGAEVSFAGNCRLGTGCVIEQGAILSDVTLGCDNHVRAYSVLNGIAAGARNLMGPFCFLRDGCAIGDDCILGAHLEAARSRFASRVKISHRAFIGDAEIGEDTIVGAGVVFCNYHAEQRHRSRIGAGVTLGSGTLLVAPLTVGDGSIVAAGSLINKDVPAHAKIIQKRV